MPAIAALAIPATSHLGALRDAADAALDGVPADATVVLLSAGDEPLLHDVAVVTAPMGAATAEAALTIDTSLLEAIVRRGQAPRVQARQLRGALGRLASHLVERHPTVRVVPMTVPARATDAALDGVATGVEHAVDRTRGPVAIIAAGDLSGTTAAAPAGQGGSPGAAETPTVGARDWDERAVAAIECTDVAAFAALGPGPAGRMRAGGWAPLHVLLRVADLTGLRIATTTYTNVDGAGRVVATTDSSSATAGGALAIDGADDAGPTP